VYVRVDYNSLRCGNSSGLNRWTVFHREFAKEYCGEKFENDFIEMHRSPRVPVSSGKSFVRFSTVNTATCPQGCPHPREL
jgi:hypothetical protein